MNDEKIPDAVKGRDDEPLALPRVLEIGREVANDRDALYRTLVSTRDPGLDPVVVALWAATAADAILADGFRRPTASVSEGPSRGADAPLAHQEHPAVTLAQAYHTHARHVAAAHQAEDAVKRLAQTYAADLTAAQATAERLRLALVEARVYIAQRTAPMVWEAWSGSIVDKIDAALGAASDSAKDKETGTPHALGATPAQCAMDEAQDKETGNG